MVGHVGVAGEVDHVVVAGLVVAQAPAQTGEAALLLHHKLHSASAGCGQDAGLLGLVVEQRADVLGRRGHEQRSKWTVGNRPAPSDLGYLPHGAERPAHVRGQHARSVGGQLPGQVAKAVADVEAQS